MFQENKRLFAYPYGNCLSLYFGLKYKGMYVVPKLVGQSVSKSQQITL